MQSTTLQKANQDYSKWPSSTPKENPRSPDKGPWRAGRRTKPPTPSWPHVGWVALSRSPPVSVPRSSWTPGISLMLETGLGAHLSHWEQEDFFPSQSDYFPITTKPLSIHHSSFSVAFHFEGTGFDIEIIVSIGKKQSLFLQAIASTETLIKSFPSHKPLVL